RRSSLVTTSTTSTTRTTYRADHVGSLLRPPEVLEAHAAYGQGNLSREQLTAVEDTPILAAFDLHGAGGLNIFNDGEYRPSKWAGDFISSVDGYTLAEVPIRFEWRLPDAVETQQAEGQLAAVLASTPQMSGMVVGERLRQKQRLTERELPFLQERAPGAFKVTL